MTTPSAQRIINRFKFRAWDTEERRMIYYPKWATLHDKSVLYFAHDNEDYVDDSNNNTNVILMQFTGLYDKEGKEIWESDIIGLETVKGIIPAWKVCWHEGYGCWIVVQLGAKKKSRSYIPLGFWKSHSVIGNLYEHPHLLAPENNNSPDLVENTSGIQTTFFVVKKPEGFEEHPVEFPPGYEYTVRAGAAFDDHKGEIELITPTEKDRDYQKQKQWKDF